MPKLDFLGRTFVLGATFFRGTKSPTLVCRNRTARLLLAGAKANEDGRLCRDSELGAIRGMFGPRAGGGGVGAAGRRAAGVARGVVAFPLRLLLADARLRVCRVGGRDRLALRARGGVARTRPAPASALRGAR